MQVHQDHQGDSVRSNIRTGSSFSLASTASDSDFEKSSSTVFEKNSSQFNDKNELEDNEDALKEALVGYHHLNKIPEDLIHATIVSLVDSNTMLTGMRKALLDREILKENLADYQYRLFEKYSVNPNDLVKLEKLLYVTVGDVFRVFNKRNRRFYLLKEIKRQDFQKQSQFETVCWIEIQNLLKVRELDDPTLMRLYYIDFDEEGETCNILVEVTFGRLWEYAGCMKYYGLEWKEEDLEYILSQLLSQVLKLKSIGMHHRDIRPKHILISYKHEGIKFGYYGCGCITEPGVQKLDIVGTPHYMAPELISAIIRREKFAEYDPYLSDLFSVGVTMLMVIEPELKRKNISEFLENVVKTKYPGLYPTLKDILGHPSQRDEGVQKFLAKEIRIQSCAEFEARTVGDRYKLFIFQRIMNNNNQIKTSLYFDMCILDHVLLIIKKKIDLLTQDKDPQDQNLEEVIWRIKLARCYYMQMNYECALKELFEIIQRKELKSFDTPNSLAKAKTLLWLGVVKEKLGRKTDCVANLMQCLGRRVAEFGEVHKSIIEVLWHLGDIKVGQEDFVGAKKAFHKCIEIGEQLDPKQRKYMAKGLYSLGVLAGLRDEHEEALKLFERGKEIALAVHGEFHPAVADQLLAIGNTYIVLGRSEEGLDLYEGALATKMRWYGENNPEIAVTYTKIARGYDRMGKYKEALEYLEKSVEIWKKVEEEENQELADVYQLIGSVLCKKGNYLKSLDYANKVIKSKETTFGKNHPWLAGTYVWRAEICSTLGLENEKQKSLEDFRVIDFDKVELNIDNIKIGFRAVGLFTEEGNIEKAQEYLQKAYQMCIDLAVPKTAKTYSCYCEALGRLQMAEGKLGEALEALKEALHVRDCLPCQDPDVETGLYNILGDLYETLENNQEALSCRRKSMELVERYLGRGSLLMLKAQINLSKTLQKIGKYEESREKLSAAQKLIEGLKVTKHHPLFQKCMDLQNKLEGRQINM